MATDVNVKVAVRCRPLNAREIQLGSRCVVTVENGISIRLCNPLAMLSTDKQRQTGDSTSDAGYKDFTYDHAYFTDSTQAQVYDDVAECIITQALQGFNGTIFAYGQTGSGKTHTMMGVEDDLGIIPRINREIFNRISNTVELESESDVKYLVTVSYLEIYNEIVKDLLNPSNKVLKIREHIDLGIYVENLSELVVKDAQEVSRLIQQGNGVRQVAATQMNERSSRSHSCFTIKISSKKVETHNGCRKETCTTAKINLVDLAGSERASKTGASGDRLKEGAAINKSLSALGNVINMLTDKSKKKKHVPYRDSKLTRLLQESLGGNSLTVMIAAISPAADNYDETLTTLQYATRAKSIRNATKRNEDVNERLIRELREEIERLRQAAGGPTLSQTPTESSQSILQMQEMMNALERVKQESWEEKQRLTGLYEKERSHNLNNDDKILSFMQSMKQEKAQVFTRINKLQQQKSQYTRQAREAKLDYVMHKEQLYKLTADFQEMQRENTFSAEVKKEKLDALGVKKTQLLQCRDELGKLKAAIAHCKIQIENEEAELVAKVALLDESNQIRTAIEEDERAKMLLVKEKFLQDAMHDEREAMSLRMTEEIARYQALSDSMAQKERMWLDQSENDRQKITALELESKHMREREKHIKCTLQIKLAALEKTFEQEYLDLYEKYNRAIELLRAVQQSSSV